MTDAPTTHPATATGRPPSGTTASDPAAVVDAYHRAWTSGQVDLALSHVSDDVRCSAPDQQAMTKDQWRAYLSGFQPMLTGVPERARMSSGEQVALWYYPQTAVTSTTLASELFTVRDGRIVAIDLPFDRLGYLPLGEGPR